jgi:hypothetical protein
MEEVHRCITLLTFSNELERKLKYFLSLMLRSRLSSTVVWNANDTNEQTKDKDK